MTLRAHPIRAVAMRALDLLDRLPNIAYALVVLVTALAPIAAIGCAIFAILGAVT